MAYRLIAGAAASALLLGGAASAGDRWGRGWDRHGHGHHHDRHDDDGEDAALLIGGAILGLVVGSALADGGGSSRSTYSYGYSSSPYGYGGNYYGYDYTYSRPSYPSYGYGQPSYGYAPPPPSYSYAPPVYTPAPTYATAPVYAAPKACTEVRSGRTATGAVIGGVVGGLLGSGVAANGAREEGTAVGAVVGSVLGGSIGHSTSDCNDAAYYQAGYAPSAPRIGGPLGSVQPYSSQPSYGYENDLYGGPGYQPGYGSSGGYAGEECERTTRVTRLPDGSEISEPVTVCRQATYDGWSVRP